MSLFSRIDEFDAAFFGKFGEAAYHYPAGDSARKQAITVVLVEDELIGSNEVSGDGKVIEEREGRMFRHSAVFECEVGLGISELSRPVDRLRVFASDAEKAAYDAGDTSKGTMYSIKRRLGRDRSMEAWLCVRVDRVSVRGESERG